MLFTLEVLPPLSPQFSFTSCTTVLPTSVTNKLNLSLDLKALYLCHLPLLASLWKDFKGRVLLAWWLISLPPKMIIKTWCFLTTGLVGKPSLDILHFIRVSKYNLDDLFKWWCHQDCPHERRVIAAAEERICMGARGGLYFSTWCMSSQRHDRLAGQVSAQIRLRFLFWIMIRKEKIWSFESWLKWNKTIDFIIFCQAWLTQSTIDTSSATLHQKTSLINLSLFQTYLFAH